MRYGLQFHPEITAESFSRRFPSRSWPRHLVGPDEGSLDLDTCDWLVKCLEPFTGPFDSGSLDRRCYFYYDAVASPRRPVTYSGDLRDVLLTFDSKIRVEGVRTTPTWWWSEDRAWCVCTDYDLTFTLIGGPSLLANALLADDVLECVQVEASSRVDDAGDQLNK